MDQLLAKLVLSAGTGGCTVGAPCAPDAVSAAEREFRSRYGSDLPPAYKRIMRQANGIMSASATVFPLTAAAPFAMTLLDANEFHRRELFAHFLYFGQAGDEVYGFDPVNAVYCAADERGEGVWATYRGDEEMFEAMLAAVLDSRS